MTYQCSKCSYKIKKDEEPKMCPYCGCEGTVKKIPSAQDWLNSNN